MLRGAGDRPLRSVVHVYRVPPVGLGQDLGAGRVPGPVQRTRKVARGGAGGPTGLAGSDRLANLRQDTVANDTRYCLAGQP